MGLSREFHFQEGFTGEAITLTVDGKTVARFEARTRMQLGLAKIETLELEEGQTVVIAVPEKGLRAEYHVDEGDRWVTINMVDRALVVQSAQNGPGYL